jgi:single-strand DNA-binding protein
MKMVPNKPMPANFKNNKESAKQFIATREVRETNRFNTPTPGSERQASPVRQPQITGDQTSERLSANSAQPNGERNDHNIVNQVLLAGRLGRDAEVRQTKSGRTVANFSVGVEESYKDRMGEWQRKTAWHRVQVWGEVAETVSADLRKGAHVYIEGALIIRNWIDKQNTKHTTTEIVATNVRFLSMAPKDQLRGAWNFVEEHSANLH